MQKKRSIKPKIRRKAKKSPDVWQGQHQALEVQQTLISLTQEIIFPVGIILRKQREYCKMQETVSRETVSFFVFCPDFCPPHAGGSRGCRCKKVLYTLCFLLYNINRNNKEGESYGEEKDRRAGGGARPVRGPRAPRACRKRPEQLQQKLGGKVKLPADCSESPKFLYISLKI